jgi:hypothetical protein
MARDPTMQALVPILKRDKVSIRYCDEIITMEVSKYMTARKLKEFAALYFKVNPDEFYLVDIVNGKVLYTLVDTKPLSRYFLLPSLPLELSASKTPSLPSLLNSFFSEPSSMPVIDSSIPTIASPTFSCYLVSLLHCLIRSTNFKVEMAVAARQTQGRLSITFRDRWIRKRSLTHSS